MTNETFEEYIWDVELDCGHAVVVEKFVPGAPGDWFRCFDDDHHGEVIVAANVAAALREQA